MIGLRTKLFLIHSRITEICPVRTHEWKAPVRPRGANPNFQAAKLNGKKGADRSGYRYEVNAKKAGE